MHPYKGKFHPKMVRALLNYIYPEDKGIILDNFAGCGTLLVEAGYLGLDSVGVEINPLSVLMSNVKCHSVKIDTYKLRTYRDNYLEKLDNEIKAFLQFSKGQTSLTKSSVDPSKTKEESKQLLKELMKTNGFNGSEFVIQQTIIARELLKNIQDKDIREFLLLSLSGAISDVSRRTKDDFERVLRGRINDLYLRIYLFQKLNEVLKIKVGDAETYCGDTRNMRKIEGFPTKDGFVDGIINSPPYSTALDYIKNDYPQLVLLRLVGSMEELEKNMIGNPRINYDKKELLMLVKDEEKDPLKMSELAHKYVDILLNNRRQDAGLRVYKFFIDMLLALKEMHRVMKKGSKCAIIVGNNHFMVGNKYVEIPNDEVILEVAKKIGFREALVIERELQKTSVGNIRSENVIILEKT
jgi:site-specific DNA-methyltransferase (cytosine-N4-specific)